MEWHAIRRWIGTTNGRVVAGSVVVAIFVAFGVLLFLCGDVPESRPTPVGASLSALVAAPAASPASGPAPVALAADPNGVEEVQTCGGAWLKADAAGRADAEEAEALRLRSDEEMRNRVLAAMASGDERSQSAAHLFRFQLDRMPAPCPQGTVCAEPAEIEQRAREAGPERTALVQLAQGTSDPQVYAWAFRVCNDPAAGPESPCQLLGTEQWIRLDPSNALPWLYKAAAAERQGDADALDDAIFHVAHAERLRTGYGLLTSMAMARVSLGDAYPEGSLDLEAATMAAESFTVPNEATTRFCSTAHLGDANRRELCDGVASLLVTGSDTFLERKIGVSMGRRMGWSPERIAALEEEGDALLETLPVVVVSADQASSCAQLRRGLDHILDVGSYGEVGAARRAIARSGTPIAVLAANHRRNDAAESAPRQQAAAAAPASSPQN